MMDVKDAESAKLALQHYDFTVFYQRFLEAIRRLSMSSRQYNIRKTSYVTKELVQALLLKLAESLTKGILPPKSEKACNGILEFVVCPRVAEELALQQDGKTLWSDEWLQVIAKLTEKESTPDYTTELSIKLRPVLYSFLVMLRCTKLWQNRQSEVLKILNSMVLAIDNRKGIFTLPAGFEEFYDDVEDYLEDTEMRPMEEVEAAYAFKHDRQKVCYVKKLFMVHDLFCTCNHVF